MGSVFRSFGAFQGNFWSVALFIPVGPGENGKKKGKCTFLKIPQWPEFEREKNWWQGGHGLMRTTFGSSCIFNFCWGRFTRAPLGGAKKGELSGRKECSQSTTPTHCAVLLYTFRWRTTNECLFFEASSFKCPPLFRCAVDNSNLWIHKVMYSGCQFG